MEAPIAVGSRSTSDPVGNPLPVPVPVGITQRVAVPFGNSLLVAVPNVNSRPIPVVNSRPTIAPFGNSQPVAGPVNSPQIAQNPLPSNTPPTTSPKKRRYGRTIRQTPNQQPRIKVQVSGFPDHTRKQDLSEAFSKFGDVVINNLTNRMATLSFQSEEEAAKAIQASNNICVDGEKVTVKPFSKKDFKNEVRIEQTRELYPRSKEKSEIIDPKFLDLSGDFHEQFDYILKTIRLTQEEVTALCALYTDIEDVLQELWPGCRAIPFGSITNGLGIKSSDADCFVSVTGSRNGCGAAGGAAVLTAKRLLQRKPRTFAEVLAIPRANTPIVKLFHLPTQTNCDLTFKTLLGVQNSRMTAFLLQADPRIVPMAVLIKYWAKVHGLSGSGKLTNYALTLLVLFYLQQPPVSMLPSVESLQMNPNCNEFVDNWNTGISRDVRLIPRPSNLSLTIPELLGGFFQYYSTFDFEKLVVCPYLGRPIEKKLFQDLAQMPDNFNLYKYNVGHELVYPIRYLSSMCVQDPFEQCHNVSSVINRALAAEIIAYFKFAATAYEKEKSNACQEFLKIILLQKPKTPRTKGSPGYRVKLDGKVIGQIANPDWKSAVRHNILKIFEDVLKIKLGKVEEKLAVGEGNHKEKYFGTIRFALWKRKTFTKLYNKTKLGFLEKEAKITEEIMNAGKHPVNVDFTLSVTYRQSRVTILYITLGEKGDLESFKEFGKFFSTIIHSWFLYLVQSQSKNKVETSDKMPKIGELTLNSNSNVDSDDDTDVDVSNGLVVENSKVQVTETQVQVTGTPVQEAIDTKPQTLAH